MAAWALGGVFLLWWAPRHGTATITEITFALAAWVGIAAGAGVPLAAVVTSPLERCRETAKLMAPGVGAVTSKVPAPVAAWWSGAAATTTVSPSLGRPISSRPAYARVSARN